MNYCIHYKLRNPDTMEYSFNHSGELDEALQLMKSQLGESQWNRVEFLEVSEGECGWPIKETPKNFQKIEALQQQSQKETVPPFHDAHCPEGVIAIDLGLPSGTKWASCNVGANMPEEFGDYYAWGATEVSSEGLNEDYLSSNICGTQHDVAHMKWGGEWRMPNYAQILELIDNCTHEWTKLNEVKGSKFTGLNGNSIFLPAAGPKLPGLRSFYWSGSYDKIKKDPNCLFLSRGETVLKPYWKIGTVRPVICGNEPELVICENKPLEKDEVSAIIDNLIANMVFVEGGFFRMTGRKTILSSFFIGRYVVTQEEWTAVMGINPSSVKGAKLPVTNVSWENCQEFISKLNAMTGKAFRLPTEAEWEYAAIGGNKRTNPNIIYYNYAGSNNLDSVAWYNDNSENKPHDVGQKSPNQLGLYDMSGNVWEWCSDYQYEINAQQYQHKTSRTQINPKGPKSGKERLQRGGSFSTIADFCRVYLYHSWSNTPDARCRDLGFRLAL